MTGIPKTPIQLYKYLLRQLPRLPAESQSYYRNYIKGVRNVPWCCCSIVRVSLSFEQNFRAHTDEVDSQRISEMIKKLYDDFQWILQKVTMIHLFITVISASLVHF